MTKSLSRHSLIGDRLTKFVYLDETGTNKKDPHLVVAGIFVDPDKALSDLEQRLKVIAIDLIPSPLFLSSMSNKGYFSFHAVDYLNGNKEYEAYKKDGAWTKENGLAVAEAIVAAIEELGCAVVWGSHPNSDDIGKDYRHAFALAKAMKSVELYMLQNYYGENCIIVAENCDEHKKAIKQMVNTITSPLGSVQLGLDSSGFPLKTIRDTVHFVSKGESIGCQVADTVCYILKKVIDGNDRFDDLGKRVLSLAIS